MATQDDKLRKNHYHGLPFKVTNYFDFIARETRELMAQLGVKRLVDLIGRTDLLKELEGFTAKQQKLELSKLLETAQPHPGKAVYCTENNLPALKPRSFSEALIACQSRYNLEYCNNVTNAAGRRVRGFLGVEVLVRNHISVFSGDSMRTYVPEDVPEEWRR